MSADGRTFTPRQRVATDGRPHHPQLAVSPGGVVAMAWDELSGARRTIAGARGRVTADVLARVDTAAHAAGIYPVISATNRGFIEAWTAGAPDASTITVEDWR
jgi:hypothetical protein